MLAWSPDPVPYREIELDDGRRTEVVISRNDETAVSVQEAANIVHRIFPAAPVPIKIDPIDLAYGLTFHVVLDAGSTHAVFADVWFKASISDPHGYVTLEVPQS